MIKIFLTDHTRMSYLNEDHIVQIDSDHPGSIIYLTDGRHVKSGLSVEEVIKLIEKSITVGPIVADKIQRLGDFEKQWLKTHPAGPFFNYNEKIDEENSVKLYTPYGTITVNKKDIDASYYVSGQFMVVVTGKEMACYNFDKEEIQKIVEANK